jgi:hypothetical protein
METATIRAVNDRVTNLTIVEFLRGWAIDRRSTMSGSTGGEVGGWSGRAKSRGTSWKIGLDKIDASPDGWLDPC